MALGRSDPPEMNNRILSALATATLLAAGCNRQPPVIIEGTPPPSPPTPVARTVTFETHALRREIDTFEHTPSVVQGARVKKAFAEIDGEIAELIEHVAKKSGSERAEAALKLADLRAYRDAEQVRFLRLEALAPSQPRQVTEQPARDGTAEKVGEKIDEAARKVGNKVRDAAEVIRDRTR